jgi:hypothetical protein
MYATMLGIFPNFTTTDPGCSVESQAAEREGAIFMATDGGRVVAVILRDFFILINFFRF